MVISKHEYPPLPSMTSYTQKYDNNQHFCERYLPCARLYSKCSYELGFISSSEQPEEVVL